MSPLGQRHSHSGISVAQRSDARATVPKTEKRKFHHVSYYYENPKTLTLYNHVLSIFQ